MLPNKFIVTGRPYGQYKGISERAIAFKIIQINEPKINDHVELFPISPDTSLPSYSPFLQYTIEVKLREIGSVYDIINVIQVSRYREALMKKDILIYIF